MLLRLHMSTVPQSECVCMQLFSVREQAQLDVYGLWAVIRNQLGTDDSFAFNKTLTRIKESIGNLAVADAETEVALNRVQVSLWRSLCGTSMTAHAMILLLHAWLCMLIC